MRQDCAASTISSMSNVNGLLPKWQLRLLCHAELDAASYKSTGYETLKQVQGDK